MRDIALLRGEVTTAFHALCRNTECLGYEVAGRLDEHTFSYFKTGLGALGWRRLKHPNPNGDGRFINGLYCPTCVPLFAPTALEETLP
jgi:hypothetical protein